LINQQHAELCIFNNNIINLSVDTICHYRLESTIIVYLSVISVELVKWYFSFWQVIRRN